MLWAAGLPYPNQTRTEAMAKKKKKKKAKKAKK